MIYINDTSYRKALNL